MKIFINGEEIRIETEEKRPELELGGVLETKRTYTLAGFIQNKERV